METLCLTLSFLKHLIDPMQLVRLDIWTQSIPERLTIGWDFEIHIIAISTEVS